MTVVFEILASDGERSKAEFNTDDLIKDSVVSLSFTCCGANISVKLFSVKETAGGALKDCALYPFAVSFKADSEISLSRARIAVDLPKGDEVLFYDAACCTNAFARIRRYEGEKSDNDFFARDIFMAQADCGRGKERACLNIAFATFKRFYTRFRLLDGSVIAEYELEDKIVKPGQEYELEHIFIDNTYEALGFFEYYTEYLAKTNDIPKFKYIPKGWSSWSCYYGTVNEEKVIKQTESVKKELYDSGATLIQLDDGWQKEGSFGGYWTTNYERFPRGMKWLADTLKEQGFTFGIWLAPGLIRDTSPLFEELMPYLVKEADGSLLKCFGGSGSLSAEKDGSIYALDIGKAEVLKRVSEMFLRAKNKFGADYFKVDFITNLLYRTAYGTPVAYNDGYSVELYRRFAFEMRKCVSEDSFLLACGAPIGESIGFFDSIRVSPDIAWEGAGKNGLPEPFEIITKVSQNVILRSPYHMKVFINDPDALLVRNYLTEHADDGLCLSDDEARLWATVVLMSGGHILLNEEIDRLPAKRMALAKRVMKLSAEISARAGNAASRPRDFFEFPYCTETYTPTNDGAFICALYNWSEGSCEKCFNSDTYFPVGTYSTYILKDLWTGECICEGKKGVLLFEMPPHSSLLLEVRRV